MLCPGNPLSISSAVTELFVLPSFTVRNFYNFPAILLPVRQINSNSLFVLIFPLYHNVHAILNFPETSQPKKNKVFFPKLSKQ